MKKKIVINRAALSTKFPIHTSITFLLCYYIWSHLIPQWALGIIWLIFFFVWLIAIISVVREYGQWVNPLDTYNMDEHPLDAYKQDMGIKDVVKDKSFRDKLASKIKDKAQ